MLLYRKHSLLEFYNTFIICYVIFYRDGKVNGQFLKK